MIELFLTMDRMTKAGSTPMATYASSSMILYLCRAEKWTCFFFSASKGSRQFAVNISDRSSVSG